MMLRIIIGVLINPGKKTAVNHYDHNQHERGHRSDFRRGGRVVVSPYLPWLIEHREIEDGNGCEQDSQYLDMESLLAQVELGRRGKEDHAGHDVDDKTKDGGGQ